jgi:hypothetical protein
MALLAGVLKVISLAVEMSTQVTIVLMEMTVVVVHHRLELINKRKCKVKYPALKIFITLQMSQLH